MWAVTHDFEFSFSIGDLLKEVHGPQWSVYFENKLREDYNAIKIYFPRLIAGFYPKKSSDFEEDLQLICEKTEKFLKDTSTSKAAKEHFQGPYSFLFFLTAFDFALERKGEFKEESGCALMDMIETLLEMAEFPGTYLEYDNEFKEVFRWTADSPIPGFTTSLVANFALEYMYGSGGTDKKHITKSYLMLNADSVKASERVSIYVCMFRKILMSDIVSTHSNDACLPTLLREYLHTGSKHSSLKYLEGCEK